MVCPNCGFQHTDEVVLCQQCGAALRMSGDAPSVVTAMKSLGASGGFLAGIIVYTLALIVATLSAIDVSGYFCELYVNPEQSIIAITIVWSRILPAVLIAVGLWITYLSARDRGSNRLQTKGLTLIRGVMVAHQVLAGLALIGLVVSLFVGNWMAWREVPWGEKLTLSFLVITSLIIAFLYYTQAAHTIGVIVDAAKRGIAITQKVSPFVAAVQIVVGIATALAYIVIVARGMNLYAAVPVELFLSFCVAVSYSVFGVYILRYKYQLDPYRRQDCRSVQTEDPDTGSGE